MSAARPPFDRRLARVPVRPLSRTALHLNHVTLASAVPAPSGTALSATRDAGDADLGAGLLVLARFLDHRDGEPARQTGRTSRLDNGLDRLTGGAAVCRAYALRARAGPGGG